MRRFSLWKPVYSRAEGTCFDNSMTETFFESGDLIRGVGLFNGGHFFDAHEVLEDVWNSVPRRHSSRRHFQGLVQVAVAFHHASRENYLGARSVLERALRNLDGAEVSLPWVDLERLRHDVAPWQRYLADNGRNEPQPEWPEITLRKSSNASNAKSSPRAGSKKITASERATTKRRPPR